ncbi:MAG: outer membrane lipoprotein carrier protein LolA [Bacteroidales bacterium]|nr:outer membrane lipoprotein carrier protein LolA [Bacteroidales bacterium]
MNKYCFIILLVFICTVSHSQQDPVAKKILDESAEKTKSYKTIQADFTLVITNRIENAVSESTGKIKIKGPKYYIDMVGSQVFFDGKTMWNYVQEIEEVTITEPDTEDEDFLDNPAKIFTWYNRDFKYAYIQEIVIDGEKMHEIDLFPKNLNQPYSRIKVFIRVSDLNIVKITSFGKEGTDYSINLFNISVDKDLGDAWFTFDVSKHKKTEIIDMRF